MNSFSTRRKEAQLYLVQPAKQVSRHSLSRASCRHCTSRSCHPSPDPKKKKQKREETPIKRKLIYKDISFLKQMKWSSFNDCVLRLNEFVYVLVYPQQLTSTCVSHSIVIRIRWSQTIMSMSWSAKIILVMHG